jgi:hypothetical protein
MLKKENENLINARYGKIVCYYSEKENLEKTDNIYSIELNFMLNVFKSISSIAFQKTDQGYLKITMKNAKVKEKYPHILISTAGRKYKSIFPTVN